jgi:capsule polysaccharide export protein KpsE/RkpR
MERQHTKRILKISLVSLVLVIVIGYTIFASHNFILGPRIILEEPQNGSTLTNSSVVIKGVAQRSQDITLNGRSILIDDQGNFKETTLLAEGYNAITLSATDKFGRKKEYRLELIYKVN